MELAHYAAEHGVTIQSRHADYIRWSPSAGAELWVQRSKRGKVIGCNPHFNGTSRIQVGITRPPIGANKWRLDGRLYCWSDATEGEIESGVPIVFDIPDFDLIRERIIVPTLITLQVAAFARELACYANDTEFAISQSGDMKFAAESYLPSGTFTPELDTRDPPEAEAIFTGHILKTELLTNSFTGRQFHCASVRTLPGIIDVVADPEVVEGQPIVGGVAKGSFWLTGRVTSDLPPSQNKGLLIRLFSRM